ncbi:MAG: hypothetical protein WBE86_04955 [Candidatus Acidiferrales bacterium]
MSPMFPSLFDPDFKRQWAKLRLDELAAEAAIIQDSNKPKLTTEDDLENSRYVFRFQGMHDARVFQAALRAGDFIYNLRAALDHLAWQLALLSGGWPSIEVSFPICEKDNADARRFIKRSTVGIPDPAVAVIESFQPYHAGNDFRSTHLWRLNKLWNIDKHRHLTPHGIVPEWQFKTNGVSVIEVRQIDDGVEYRVSLAEKEKIEFNPSCKVDFTISDSAEAIDIRIADLFEMYEFVASTILPAFAGFFPQKAVDSQGV